MKTKYTALRFLLWMICIYHVGFGLLANAPSDLMRRAATVLLGIHLPDDPTLLYVVKPFGIYCIIFGVMMGVAAWNPVKNRALISIGVVLFALRIGQRLLNLDAMQQALGVTPQRNLATIAVVAVFGVALALLRWIVYRDMHQGSGADSLPSSSVR